jgi:hypothetical protein
VDPSPHQKTRPRRDRLQINAAIREVIELTRGEAESSGVSVQTQLAEGLPLIEGDPVEQRKSRPLWKLRSVHGVPRNTISAATGRA